MLNQNFYLFFSCCWFSVLHSNIAYLFRYLASGNTFTDLHYSYRMGVSTISSIVQEVCGNIWMTLNHECIPPLSEERLEGIAAGFHRKTQFPHCLGAVDGKHIRIIKPCDSGSLFWNYKDFYSMVLLAVADSEYRFVFVNIGAYGKDCDSSLFKETQLWRDIANNDLPIPKPKPLSESIPGCTPYVFVGDEGFGIHMNLMRPYSGKIMDQQKRVFNYRLSRARRYVECSFGILSNKWRVFHRPLNVSVELSMKIVQACCVLHNFVRERDGYNFEDTLTIEGFNAVPYMEGERGNKSGNDIRKAFAEYFMTQEGSVAWQWKM